MNELQHIQPLEQAPVASIVHIGKRRQVRPDKLAVPEWESWIRGRLMDRLRRGKFLDGRLQEADVGAPLDDSTLDCLLNVIHSAPECRWRERTLSTLWIGQAPLTYAQRVAAGSEIAVAQASKPKSGLKREVWNVVRYMEAATATVMVSGALFAAAICLFSGSALGALIQAAGWLTIPFTIVYASQAAHNRQETMRAAANCALGRLEWSDSAGLLAGRALADSKLCARTALYALKSVLPSLTPNDYGRLEAEAVPALCRALEAIAWTPNIDSNFRTAVRWEILRALQRMGDGRAVGTVTRIAQRPQEPLRQYAAEILPTLLERQRIEQSHYMLLRGSSAPGSAPDSLLRAAQTTPGIDDPTILLRAADETRPA